MGERFVGDFSPVVQVWRGVGGSPLTPESRCTPRCTPHTNKTRSWPSDLRGILAAFQLTSFVSS